MNNKLRDLSSTTTVRRAILCMMCFSASFYNNTLLLCDLRVDDYLGCSIRTKAIYNQTYVILQILILTVVAPYLMALFGILTIYNTKRIRFVPTVNASYRQTESQLVRMLLLQVITYIDLNIPICIMYLMIVLPTGYELSSGFIFGFVIADFAFTFSYTLFFSSSFRLSFTDKYSFKLYIKYFILILAFESTQFMQQRLVLCQLFLFVR